ncbi:YhgE/Pip domain-containing protein [Desulfosporosinus sp. FKA]|uniref:YhgE/Pip domain-containing protein n=1 Tax=Desulfosporosinus sp. FKA TaxID=1969834 RepID=UPI000B49EC7C|nr:YhgE/Pip domain-containing protein [Desulfosporosinus sp. FKA]
MKNILKLYSNDLKRIKSNPIALIIIAGLCILPSLYAWVNILACWDPYENTGSIPVAVVNQDQGVTYQGKLINIGNTVVNTLKTNKQIGWKFVSDNEANLGVVDGTYFAVIEIPSNFSASFVSFLTTAAKKPEIVYKVDTKTDPVAGKITEAAKSSLVDQISTSFISTVNTSIFTMFNKVGADAAANKSKIIQWKDEIIQINRNMSLILPLLQDINSRSGNLSSFLSEIQAAMPGVDNQLSDLAQINDNNSAMLKTTQLTLNQSFDTIETGLNNAQASVNRIHDLLQSVNSLAANTSASQVNSTIGQINLELEALNNQISTIITYLQKFNDINPSTHLAKLIASLQSIKNSLTSETNQLNSLQQQFNQANTINQTLWQQLDEITTNLNSQIIQTANSYNGSARKDLNAIAGNLTNAANDASNLITSAQGLQAQINNLMGTAIQGSQLAAKVSGDLRSRLLEYQEIISALSDKLQMVSNNDLAQILSILQSNPELMGSYIASPFNLQEESIYGVPNYGSAMAPVYTVLALWVGTLILTSLLKTETAYFEGIETLSLREKHFGKMLTFITLALVQGLIVSLGDKLLLGVYSVSTPLMIVAALMSSLTFVIITYTLVSLLGNLGKALAVIYMIVQLAGSGGTYPIQVDPLILRILQPTFPFTYAIALFREAMAGPLISSVALDFFMLILISVIFILLGFFLKKVLYEHVRKFETNFKLSGIGE